MKTISFLFVCFLAGVLPVLSGCASAPAEKAPESLEKVLDGGPIQLHLAQSQSIQVVLDGNATTGYTWQFVNETPQIVAVEKGKYIPLNPNMAGAPGKFTWKLKALKPGQGKVVFRYYRSWEGFDPEKDREQVYLITVTESMNKE